MNVACYCRVSTEEQALEGFSIAAQRDRLIAFCHAQGWTPSCFYIDEGVSGAKIDRPEFLRLRSDAKARKFDLVLVWKVDRLSRKVAHLAQVVEELDNLGIGLRSATEPFDTSHASGRAFLQMLAVFAELERENIRERSRAGIRERVKEGYIHGRPVMVGYRCSAKGKWEVDQEGAEIVRWIFSQYLAGVGTFSLAQRLKAGGIPGLSDEKIRQEFQQPRPESIASRLRWILRNPIYAGFAPLGDDLFPGRHEAIIEPDVWRKACQLMDSRKAIPNRAHTSRYILTGRIYCGVCGAPMAGKRDRNDSRSPEIVAKRPFYEYYVCMNSTQTRGRYRTCTAGRISKQTAEAAVLNAIKELSLHPEQALTPGDLDPQKDELQTRRRSIQSSLSQLDRRRRRWIEVFETTPEIQDTILARLRQLAEEEKALTEELASLEKTIEASGAPLDAEVLTTYLKDLAKGIDSLNEDELREVVRTLVKRIYVFPSDQRGRYGQIVKKVRVQFYQA